MIIEIYGEPINVILIARILALIFFLYVAWRLSELQNDVEHIEKLTENNYHQLQIQLADAVGIAEESVIRDKNRENERDEEDK